MSQARSEHRLFLFPKHVDLVILGSTDEQTLQTLREILRETEAGTLILSDRITSVRWDELTGSAKIVRLENGIYQAEQDGWQFLVKSCADGTAALAHGLSAGVQAGVFEDCVMSVKVLRDGVMCQRESSPDGYGCALGCALYQDHDVCKYREGREQPVFCTGTLLFGGGEDESACRELIREARENIGELRFFGLAAGHAAAQLSALEESRTDRLSAQMDDGPRHYLIGTEELDERTAARLCRGGWSQRPVILREGKGICCSGLLKYAE